MLITIQHAPAPADKFRIVSNDMLRGKFPIALKALERVILLHLISLDTGWRIDRGQIDAAVVEGRDAVSTALAGLERKGYLQRSKARATSGVWSWKWSITTDPISQPLPPVGSAPDTGFQVMAVTSGNIEDSQVSPHPGKPALVKPSIRTEDPNQKTGTEDSGSNSIEGTPVGAHATRSPRKNRDELQGHHLVNLALPSMIQRLTKLWTAVVVEEGGSVPDLGDPSWDHQGLPGGRARHPYGRQIKALLEQYDPETMSADWLERIISETRRHARAWTTATTASDAA